ncbi:MULTISPECIES: hypothetical protein [Cryobacterium]|uniref:hypothetical protein n=1 Tax=Cryobacterium TaxID=69578 RepID=UPI000CD45EF9|nr:MULTISPECIES: hypothetical protein [Cryobacterium]POH63617.1 hypothetical protein C3B60_15985 [Cryobacterium zongtaii]TFC44063.1 hypothetical protein E3O57_11520 [Cryobacterium sp. TMN-39-2]
MSRVSIVLDLPAAEYRALTAFANRRGVQAHVLVEQLVQHALATSRPTPPPAPEPAPRVGPRRDTRGYRTAPKRSRAQMRSDRDEEFVGVSKLHGQGLNDRQIAAELGISTSVAMQRRQQLRLPAQTRGRPKDTTINAARAAEKS